MGKVTHYSMPVRTKDADKPAFPTSGTITLDVKGMPAGLKREIAKLPVSKGTGKSGK